MSTSLRSSVKQHGAKHAVLPLTLSPLQQRVQWTRTMLCVRNVQRRMRSVRYLIEKSLFLNLTLPFVANLLDTGKGYLQNNFVVPCTKCNFRITKERLAVHKLITDLMRDHTHGPELEKHGDGVYLAYVSLSRPSGNLTDLHLYG